MSHSWAKVLRMTLSTHRAARAVRMLKYSGGMFNNQSGRIRADP
jgi:hypothetical protein